MLFHVVRQIQPPAVRPLQRFKGLGPLVQDADAADAVHAVVGDVVVLVEIADQVVFPLPGRHLIGADHILGAAVGADPGVQLLVRAVGEVFKRHLPPLADGLVQQLDVQEKLLVVRGVAGQPVDIPHPGAEIVVGQSL